MGNLDSKLSPYYSIIDENKSDTSILSKSSNDIYLNDLNKYNLSLWCFKKVNFNNDHKNSLLYEFNYAKYALDSKKVSLKHLKLALNQIKYLKTLRHPNIVKYFYSEEPQLNPNTNLTGHPKCILITESLRPLASVLNDLSKEQLIRGIFGITNAISFLHEKASISHNNINESSIYLNAKQTWKLSDFELALNFADLNQTNLKNIYEFKNKNSITPEEEEEINESKKKYDLDLVYKQAPHSIDSYGWAMLLINILPSNQNKSIEEVISTNSTSNIIDNLYESEDYSLDQLENFLNKDPSLRPTLKSALNLSIFDLCKEMTLNNSTVSLNTMNDDESEYLNGANTNFDPFKMENLNELEKNWPKLVDYLNNLIKNDLEHKKLKKKSTSLIINEKLIDFLLSPFMFFSDKIKKFIFPSVFIPKEETNNLFQDKNQFYLYKNWSLNKEIHLKNENEENEYLFKPFIDLDKYKAFVIPRILHLFSMHSLQIRIVLLEYFPFYISLINDQDTLKYEILPELLIGLKDKNDQLVSLTFSCLSIMVKLLGSEIVVGKTNPNNYNNMNNKYFSDNIPKSIQHQSTKNSISISNKSSNKEFKPIINNKMSYSNSLDDDMMNMMINSSEDTLINSNKMFTDSMIALHDETESMNDMNSLNHLSQKEFEPKEKNQDIEVEDDDSVYKDNEWLNDFGWSQDDKSLSSSNNNKFVQSFKNESSASLVSLAGSLKSSNIKTPQNRIPSIFNQNNEYFGAEYDIKNINIVKKTQINDPQEDLIETFLNEMKPDIKVDRSIKSSTSLNSKIENNENVNINGEKVNGVAENGSKVGGCDSAANAWECDEEINLDEI